jgi:hypothetical protein
MGVTGRGTAQRVPRATRMVKRETRSGKADLKDANQGYTTGRAFAMVPP